MKIKALIFDFGGTLARGSIDRQKYNDDIIVLLRGFGHNIDPYELRHAVSVTMEWLRDIRKGDVEPTFDVVYSRILVELEIPLNAEIISSLRSLYHKRFNVKLFPCVEDILKQLSKRYKMAIISNTISDIPRLSLTNSSLNEFFEEIVCSSDLGIRKPDPRIFCYVLDRLGVEPSEALHVGDGLKTDIEGATRAGIRAVWIRDSNDPSNYKPSIDSICDFPSMIKDIESKDNRSNRHI